MKKPSKILICLFLVITVSKTLTFAELETINISPKSFFSQKNNANDFKLNLTKRPDEWAGTDTYLCLDQFNREWFLKIIDNQEEIKNELLGFQLARFFKINTPPFYLIQGKLINNIAPELGYSDLLKEFKEGDSYALLTQNIDHLTIDQAESNNNSGLEELFVYYMLISNLDYSYYHNYKTVLIDSEKKYFAFDLSVQENDSFMANKFMNSVFLVNFFPQLNMIRVNDYIDWILSVNEADIFKYLSDNGWDTTFAKRICNEFVSKKSKFKEYFYKLINKTFNDDYYFFEFQLGGEIKSLDEIITDFEEVPFYYLYETETPIEDIIIELIPDNEKRLKFKELLNSDHEFLKYYFRNINSFVTNDLSIFKDILEELLKRSEISLEEMKSIEELKDIYLETRQMFKKKRKLFDELINNLNEKINYLSRLDLNESIMHKQLNQFSVSS